MAQELKEQLKKIREFWENPENKKRMSESIKSKMADFRRPVCQFSKSGEFIAEYTCAKEAADAVGLKSHTGINHVCKHDAHRKTAGGYVWKYKEEL